MAVQQQVESAVGAHLVGGLKAPDAETAMRRGRSSGATSTP